MTNNLITHPRPVRRALVALLLPFVAVVGLAGVASAQGDGDYVGNTTIVSSVPQQQSSVAAVEAAKAAPAAVAPAAVAADAAAAVPAPKSESLAFTGGDALRMAAIGGALVVAGGAAIMLVRRQRTTA